MHRKRTLVLGLVLAAGWLMWTLSNAAAWYASTRKDLAGIARWSAVEGPCGVLVGLLLLFVYARLRARASSPWQSILIGASLSFVAAMLWYLLTGYAYAALDYWTHGWLWDFRPERTDTLLRTISRTLVMGFFCVLYVTVDHWYRLLDETRRAGEAADLAQQAELLMLRYQLNPHFLFNALNSIRALILEDPPRARQMVTELADFLRSSLDRRRQESTIGDELAALGNYLAIQRIRFEERLLVTVRADAESRQVVVPCFLIHPLVENAVKHGMRTSPMPLRIEIDVSRRGVQLDIAVANTGRLTAPADADPRDDTGTGLDNVCRRLHLAYGGRHSFRIFESDGWVRAQIQLRLEAA